ncbi:extracellular matrix protein FRAS1-like [Elysia marginata]|uniref:Extracellular matrix protein FRAS1-like n=1 Tax=Elysia marginata TaxID=1093978 RepID=A0AAV4G614_9GAST|nr:extracellular matrix protein FRAS1-like [Elysia marginata]
MLNILPAEQCPNGYDVMERTRSIKSLSPIQFDEWQDSQSCPIIINDDTVFEGPEVFYVELTSHTFALPGEVTKAAITIFDTEDEPVLQFKEDIIHINETNDYVTVIVERSGDVSVTVSAICSTKAMTATGSSLNSLESGSDYISRGTSNDYRVVFPPGLAHAPCEVKIVDDSLSETTEQFELVLTSPSHPANLGPIKTSVVVIEGPNDESTLHLGNASLAFPEDSKEILVPVIRQGPDLSQSSSVWCHTRLSSPLSAEPGQDYTPTSLKVLFGPGQVLQMCRIELLDDELRPRLEGNETLEVFLSAATGSRIEQPASTSITIYDQHLDRKPIMKDNEIRQQYVPAFSFSSDTYIIEETNGTLNASIRRQGDVTLEASVVCYTRQQSAHVMMDFQERPLSNISRVVFAPGEESKPCVVDIVDDELYEPQESFYLKLISPLGPEGNGAKLGELTEAVITIINKEDEPTVQLESASYSVHEPTNRQQTTSVEIKVLRTGDLSHPIKVRCSTRDGSAHSGSDYNPKSGILTFEPAQPLQENGHPGVPLRSLPVTVGHSNPICKAVSTTGKIPNNLSYQAQSFLASLEYVKPAKADTEHSNMVHISVQIPHQDGMLPLVSTMPLHNLRLLLSEPIYRQQHVCSNLITARERAPLMLDHGFLEDSLLSGAPSSVSTNLSSSTHTSGLEEQPRVSKESQLPFGPGYDFPHQFNRALRGENALLLYKHLNLKTCTWEFNTWYHMTELLDLCGGQVVSDFQVRNGAKTHLTVRVPLHVSYVFATAPVGWGSLEHRTEMEVSFYYNSVLWQAGLETEGRQGGRLQVVRILIAQDGRLVMEFRTQAKFRGQFLMQHPTLPGVTSKVMSTLSSTMTFDLELVWSQATFDSPHQVWRATSNYNVKDYTGVYTVELIPCLVSATQAFDPLDDPLACTARQPERFEVPISFQQSNRPVPLSYSLNTEFQITNNARMFLMDPRTQGVADQDWEFSGSFARGQKLYGRVLWNPDQDLSSAYRLSLEKVYLCTGRDGYIPTYDPDGETYHEGPSFGCIQPSKKLLHRFLILDRRNPTWVVSDFDKIPFNAKLASQAAALSDLLPMPGVDGFVMDIDPLYKVDSGHQWHLQVVYTIGPADAPLSRARRFAPFLPFYAQTNGIPQRMRNTSADTRSHIRKRRARPKSRSGSSSHSMEDKQVIVNLDSHQFAKQTAGSEPERKTGESAYSVTKVRNGTNLIALRLAMDESSKEPDSVGNSMPTIIIVLCVICVSITLFSILVCMILGFSIRKRRRKRRKELSKLHSAYPATINNLRNTVDVKDCTAKSQDKNFQGAEVNKCNIIKAKEINLLTKQGINVDAGTEV